MTDFPIRIETDSPECMLLNLDTNNVVSEFDSYGAAQAWITETNDREENQGLPLSTYSIIPVRATPGGKDIR